MVAVWVWPYEDGDRDTPLCVSIVCYFIRLISLDAVLFRYNNSPIAVCLVSGEILSMVLVYFIMILNREMAFNFT